jgi:hypothetical protein
MISYLFVASLLIPVNLWAAITPHLHSDLSMRILRDPCGLIAVRRCPRCRFYSLSSCW